MTKKEEPIIGLVGKRKQYRPIGIDMDLLGHDSRQSEINAGIATEMRVDAMSMSRQLDKAEKTIEAVSLLAAMLHRKMSVNKAASRASEITGISKAEILERFYGAEDTLRKINR